MITMINGEPWSITTTPNGTVIREIVSSPQVITKTHISASEVFERMTDTEQDTVMNSPSNAAKRFMIRVNNGSIVEISRIRSPIETAFDAIRADELLA